MPSTNTTPPACPPHSVALETTLLAHGLPKDKGRPFADVLASIVRDAGAHPLIVGVLKGSPIAGLTDAQLDALLQTPNLPKANTANLGLLLHRRQSGATTVSTTMEIAAASGARIFATGGIGGVHMGYGTALDISADLMAFTRFPIAVVTSGVKSILDVVSTREALETLGVTVVGYRTDTFPAFYLRDSAATVDTRFDDVDELRAFLDAERTRTGRGVVICNPIPHADEIPRSDFEAWLAEAHKIAESQNAKGRGVTPALLGALHRISEGRTLAANLALVRSNTRLAAEIASGWAP